MHPVLSVLHVGPRALPITSYGVMLCLGLAVAAAGSLRAAHAARLDLGACISVLGVAAGCGFAGAWLLHTAVQCIRLRSLAAGLAQPGIAFFGGAIAGIAALWWVSPRLSVPGLAWCEHALPALACGHALGRIGCLLGGCCYGRPWQGPLAIHYHDALAPAAAAAVARHPVPLYEAAGLLALACVCALRPVRRPGTGARLRAYAAGYAALRFALEYLRGDEVRGVWFGGALSTSQLIALCVLAGCGFFQARASAAKVNAWRGSGGAAA